jgi:hypothetical protein
VRSSFDKYTESEMSAEKSVIGGLGGQLDDLKLTATGEVRDKVFDQSIQLPRLPTEPTPMLYQRPYYLSEADFEKIRRPSSRINSFGLGAISLSIINTLRLSLKLSESQFSEASITASKSEFITTGVIFCVGVIAVVWSLIFSHARKTVLKDIETHFKKNRPKLELRERPDDK